MSLRYIWKNVRGNGAKKSPVRPVWSEAHQWLSASLPPSTTGDKGKKKWPSGIMDGEKQTKHVTHKRHTLFRMYCTYRRLRYSTFSSTVRVMKRLFSRRKKQKKEEEVVRGTDVSLVISLSIRPVDAAQTPLGRMETSGKNCQWDWYSTKSNEKWISLPRYKHKWPEPWCICLDPLWSPPSPHPHPLYLRLPHSPSHVFLRQCAYTLGKVDNCKLVVRIVQIEPERWLAS